VGRESSALGGRESWLKRVGSKEIQGETLKDFVRINRKTKRSVFEILLDPIRVEKKGSLSGRREKEKGTAERDDDHEPSNGRTSQKEKETACKNGIWFRTQPKQICILKNGRLGEKRGQKEVWMKVPRKLPRQRRREDDLPNNIKTGGEPIGIKENLGHSTGENNLPQRKQARWNDEGNQKLLAGDIQKERAR